MNKNKEITEQPRTQVKNKKQKYSKKYVREIKKKLQVSMLSIVVVLLLIVGGKLAGLTVPINTVKTNEQTKLSAEESKTVEEEENIENKQSNKEIAKIDEKGETTEINKGTTGLEIKETTKESEESIKTTVNTPKLENTETVTYIYNIDDLVKFRDSVNAGNDYAGKTVCVMEDIDMSPACSETVGSWTPIGTDTTIFAGIFDGNYHTLSNLYINNNTHKYVGFFAQTTNNATIKNTIMQNEYVHSSYAGGSTTGGIVGVINGSTIQNCSVSGTVIGRHPVAGIVGATISDSKNNINGCINYATVTAVYYNNNFTGIAGGILGMTEGTTAIENCYNKGTIKCNYSTLNTPAGGILGHVSSRTPVSVSSIKNCYNTGIISTAAIRGGIVGNNYNLIPCSNNYWISSCGAKYGLGKPNGVAGSNSGATSVTEELLQNYAPTLGTSFENDDFNINGGYPILWWEAPTIELNKKQAYIQTGEDLQLEINATVGARRTVPTTRECFNY